MTNSILNESDHQPPKRRRWPWIAGIVAALIVGVGVGAAGQPEPETVTETRSVEVEVEPADLAEQRAEVEQRAVDQAQREQELAAYEAELDAYAKELDGIAADLEAEIEAVEANSVSDGIWTVGTDIEPGTYRATDVSSDCYWAVLASGSNGSDIVDNGIPGGGNPTVTVQEGHDFESSGCGEWVKQ